MLPFYGATANWQGTIAAPRARAYLSRMSADPVPNAPLPANATFEAWRESPAGLRKEFRFQGFPEAVAFVVEVARLAQAADHHPDVDLRFNKVALSLVTHDAGCVTAKDQKLAAEIDLIPAERIGDGGRSLFS
jgi:4a-hydroxytetrahydrobiopterin dehydratase